MDIDVNGLCARFDPPADATNLDGDGRLHVLVTRHNAAVLSLLFRQVVASIKDDEATELVIPAMELHPSRPLMLRVKAVRT